MVSILGAVNKLGILKLWKKIQRNYYMSHISTGDPANFRPTYLLDTIYKLDSGILARKLIRVSKENNWLSVAMKGFLPAIRGIQEHTFVLELAILEAKKKKSNLFISWLDLSNTFCSILDSKPSQVYLYPRE